MATYPDISLAGRPAPQIDPLGALQKVVSIKDSLAMLQERQDMSAQRKFALQQSMDTQADQDALETAIGQHTTVGDDGLVTTDHKAAVASLKTPKQKAKYASIIPQLDKEALQHSTDRVAMQHQSIQSQLALASEAKAAIDSAPDLATKQQAWAAIVPKWSAVDRAGAASLPRQYDPATVDPLLTGVIAHGQAENDKAMTSLQIADAKNTAAQAAMTLSKIQPSTPEGMTNKATRMADTVNALALKYKDMDPERLDAIMESVGLPKITRKTVAQPKAIGQRNGASFDDDEAPLDMEGKPLKVDKNADYNVMRMSDGSIRHQETTVKKAGPTTASLALAAANGDASAARALKTLEGMRLSSQSAGLTPETVAMLAKQFVATGTMPPLGMGSSKDREAILNSAGDLAKGQNIAANSAEFKQVQGSTVSMQRSHDAVVAFEKTASANLDLAINAAKKLEDTGSPLLNKPLREIDRSILGKAEIAAFDAARQVAVNEIAKVTSNPSLSGQLSDSARHEVAAFIPADATIQQIMAVAQILKMDMQNRRTFLEDQIKFNNDRLKGIGAPVGGGTTTAPAGPSPVKFSKDNPYAPKPK